MRTELDRYQNGVFTLKVLGAVLLVFFYLRYIIYQPLIIKIIFLLAAVALAILLNKKINSLAKVMGHYLVEFDEDNLYYTTTYREITIPLKDITAIKLDGFKLSQGFTWYYPYKVLYTDLAGIKSIRFNAPYSLFDAHPFGEFKRLVKIKNPQVEIIESYPN